MLQPTFILSGTLFIRSVQEIIRQNLQEGYILLCRRMNNDMELPATCQSCRDQHIVDDPAADGAHLSYLDVSELHGGEFRK